MNSKTIAKALQYSIIPALRLGKINPNSRVLVLFTKEKTKKKANLSLDLESLQMDMNILKTIYEKQEKG